MGDIMVAQTVALPNIKQMFVPDFGHTIYDIDLAQADAQVVAWEADDEELKAIFRDPDKDLHDENAKVIFGRCDGIYRKKAKAGVHATNYLATDYALARALDITTKEAKAFKDAWFEAHPGILEWHQRIENSLYENRTVTNQFGASITFFDRIQEVLKEAVAWIPQSTVGTVINKGILNVHNTMQEEVNLLLQVHDSSAGQYLTSLEENDEFLLQLKKCYEIVIPYEDPLVIGVGLETSTKSWGDCKPRPWPVEIGG